jgi:hypothetical protein
MTSTAKKLILLALALLGISHPASGALLRELQFGDSHAFNRFGPDIGDPVARLDDGSYAVAWLGSSDEPRLQWVRPDGSEVLEPGGRRLTAQTIVDFPVVAAHPGAGAFVAFTVQTAKGWRILVQSFDSDASPRWAGDGVPVLDSPGVEYQKNPQLLARADGSVFVCFGRFPVLAEPGREDDQTVCQRLDADGQPLWPGGRVAGSRHGVHLTPSLVADGRGGVLVFWTVIRFLVSDSQELEFLSAQGQHLSGDGVRLWEPRGKLLHEVPWLKQDSEASRLFAVSDGGGGAILAFGNEKGRSEGVLAQRVDGDGTPLWGAGVTVAASPASYYSRFPDSLTALPDGGAAAVVQEVLPNSRSELFLYRLSRSGQLRRPAQGVMLSAPGRFQMDFSSQGSFDGDRLRILWSSHVLGGGGLQVEIRIAVFDPAGRRLTPPAAPPLVAWGPGEGRYHGGFAFDATRNQGLVVWSDWFRLTTPPNSVGVNSQGGLFNGDEGIP